VLILKLLRRRWSLPLVEEEEDNGSGGGALDAPLWIALLSVSSRSESILDRPPPSLGSDLSFIYRDRSGTWWFGGNEPMVYMYQSPGGSYSSALWTVVMSSTQRSSRHHPAALS
jgi:hypothetical protein